MNISAVDICNLALDRLGHAQTITSFDETGIAATFKRIYAFNRNEVLRAHEWNCAIARADLTPMEDAPVSGYAYQYQLPVSPLCLRVLEIVDSTAAYRIEGDRLLTDIDQVSIRYIQELTDTTKFDADLVELLALKLAAAIAYKLTASHTIEQSVIQEYEFKLRRATGRNLMESRQPEPESNTSWIDAGRS